MTGREDELLQRLRDAAVALQRTTTERDELLRRASEPVAIIGMACRFPGGAGDPEAYWRLLHEGRDAVRSLDDRWKLVGSRPIPEAPNWAGLLDEVDGFDAAFFGISPREATSLDPQQRLFLELAWEALEDAGIVPGSLEGSRTGVFFGASWLDYLHSVRQLPEEAKDAYATTGNLMSVAAGRVSYTLGLQGPCVMVDTACSSSLVAVHQACDALRHGQCELALAGAVNLLLSAETMSSMTRLHAHSPDGRCRTFDASANGYVRGEGCGVVVLKRLSDARKDGDRIWALVRGSAVNQDGRSNGLTAPNGPAQEALLRDALRSARIAPQSVGYVETHGTGTPLGDPIEFEALRNVIGAPRADGSRCVLGAVKTNLGHLESAAGMAGLIKAVLALHHESIPKNLNFRTLNPRIRQAGSALVVASERVPWPRRETPRVAGVSGFGISGTNAHVLVEESPQAPPQTQAPRRSAELVVLSAKTPEALQAHGKRLRAHLAAHPELSLSDVACSAMTTRAHMEIRRALAVSTREELGDALDDPGADPPAPPGATSPKVVFVFPGQGSQWLGMGRQLLDEEPVFAEVLGACDAAIAAETGWSVREELRAPAEKSRLDRIDVVQPVLFAMSVGLAALWQSWGIEPQAVVGHSQGEIAAAYFTGALSLEDCVAIVCRRSALMKRISGQGEMALVGLSIDEALAEIAGLEDRLGIAVSNGTRSTVLSGDPALLGEVLAKLEARAIFCRRIKSDVAGHSPQMDPLLAELVSSLAGVTPRAAKVPILSTVTGQMMTGPELTPSYWADNVRQPVRFARAVKDLLGKGFSIFVEMSPHPLLVSAIDELRTELGAPGVALASLRRERPERRTLLESLGALYVHGHGLDAARLFPAGGRRVALPSYPWQRQRYWVAPAPAARIGGSSTGHPILGVRLSLAGAGADAVYESAFSVNEPAWLADHRVGEHVVVPGTALAELVRAAAEDQSGGRAALVTGLVMQSPLVVPEGSGRRVQVVLTEGGAHATIYSLATDAPSGAEWTVHAAAEVSPAPAAAPAPVDLGASRGRCRETVDVPAVYARFASLGMNYGPSFKGLRSVWRGPREALAEVVLPGGLETDGYGMHPALLDAALQTVLAAGEGQLDGPHMPFEFGRFAVHMAAASSAWAHVRFDAPTPDGVVADVTLTDASGAVVAEVGRIGLRRADLASLQRADAAAVPDAFYRIDWPVVEAPPRAPSAKAGRWAVARVGDPRKADGLVDELRATGADAQRVDVEKLGASTADHVVCLWDGEGDAEAAIRVAVEGLAVVRSLAGRKQTPRLWWATRGAVAVAPGEDVATPSPAVWGLGRALMKERPELRCTLLDVDLGQAVGEALLRELAADDGENQVAWRGGARHVARLARAPAAAPVPAGENYQVATKRRGTLDALGLVAAPRREPGPGEVEIQVAAAGLNFRDVVNALGMVSESGALGTECSGVVTRVGADVRTVAVGSRVMALVTGTFARFVTADARRVALVPDGLSLEQAAAVPGVFLTAWYALHDLGKLKRGERLVVHAAAGGVGMAAVQIAKWIGAEVLATASPPKWDVVRSLGVKHVASSRDTGFASAFKAAAGGADVVLNSLAGEFVDAGLSLLSKGGRFLEMGKTDIRDAEAVAAAHPGVTYRAFDLLSADPDLIASLFAAVVEGFTSGHLEPLPARTFPLTEAEAAFRFMAQARHVGKLVLVPPRESLRLGGTALVTGGLGGLGLEVARNLARRGMKHLVLVGRRGLSTPGAASAVKEIEGLGARVTVATADVTDRDALTRVLAAVPPDLPLRVVVHSAFVLDDGMLPDQTPDRFRAVMAPKVVGGWNLHELTRGADLDAFVLFSSVAGTLGNAAQGPYCAANVCVDALAAHRRAHGLPAASLAWGPWAEVGLAAGLSAQLQARLTGQGFLMIQPDQGMALFDQALGRSEAQLVIAPLDLEAAARSFGASLPPVWRALIRAKSARAVAAADGSWTDEMAVLPAEKRVEAVTQTVRAEVARVLALGRATAVPPDRPLRELGLDSLMAVELRNALGRRVGATLPANLAFAHPTPTAIARYLVAEVPSLAGTRVGPVAIGSEQNGTLLEPGPRPDQAPLAKALAVAAPLRPPPPIAPIVQVAQAADTIERIPMGERWLADGFRVIPTPGGFAQLAVDMTQATSALAALADAGLQASFTHVLVRAAALALARNPRLHQSVSGYRKVTPGSVDIGLSMVGQTTYAPVVVLPAVDRIPLPELVGVVEAAISTARLKETEDLKKLRSIGWLSPFGFLRRFALRIVQRSFSFRRKLVGTFQITNLPTVDVGVPLQFYSGSILSFGRVRASVVAVDGRIEVRPMLLLTVGVGPVSMDAARAAALVREIGAVLESEELVDEARGAAPSGARALSPRAGGPLPALPPRSTQATAEGGRP